MRTPFGWTLTAQTSLQVLCACCALCCAPDAALAAPEQVTPTPMASISAPAAAPSTANSNAASEDDKTSLDRRVLTLLAMACLIGVIAGWANGGPRETRFRLFNKPKKSSRLSVLVPPGPAPRLIPRDAPNAARARIRAPVPRQTPATPTRPRVINYIAAFADSAQASERSGRVDYVLVPSDGVEESGDDAPAHPFEQAG